MYRCVPSENGAVHIRNCSGSKSKRVAGGGGGRRSRLLLSFVRKRQKKKENEIKRLVDGIWSRGCF